MSESIKIKHKIHPISAVKLENDENLFDGKFCVIFYQFSANFVGFYGRDEKFHLLMLTRASSCENLPPSPEHRKQSFYENSNKVKRLID